MDTVKQQHTRNRIGEVLKRYSAYDALVDSGIELVDKFTELQIKCPWHGADNNPSARYYPSPDPHFHCYTCKLHLNGIGLYAKFRGLEFMQALSDLERRFGIKVAPLPEASLGATPRDGDISEAWQDVPRVLCDLEEKLLRLRKKAPMLDFIKWCRVIDAVRWDLDHGDSQTPQMVQILSKVRHMMNAAMEDANI